MHTSRDRQYLPSFPAADYLVPALGHLRSQLTALSVGGEQQRGDLASQLDQLPYALSGAYLAVSECVHVVAAIADAHTPLGNEFAVVPEARRFHLGFKVDNFLDAARRAQNAVLPYWSRALRLSLGKSLSGVAELALAGRSPLPEELQRVLVKYWQQHGGVVKAYRDLSQHFAVIISDVRVLRERTGQRDLRVFAALPTDPTVTSADRLAYSGPVVLAMDFVVEELQELVRFVSASLKPLLLPRSEFQPVRRLVVRGAVRNEPGGDPLGSSVMTQEQLRAALRALRPETGLGGES
jgi:hypothetical protein